MFAPLTCRQGIYKTARTIASGIRPSAISSRSLKSLRQKTFPRVKLIKTAFTSPGTFPYYPASSASVIPRTSPHDIFQRAVSNSLPPSHTAGPAPLLPPDSRHLRNIIQPLLCDCPSGLPSGRGSAHTAHNPDYVKYLPPPPSRKWTRTEPLYLRTRVSTFSKERAECRPRHPPIWLSAITRCVSGQRLQPLPTTGAHRLRLPPLQSPPHQPHHTRNCLSCGHPERRAVSSYSLETAPGKPSADSHSARRCDESAVLRSAACGRSSPSATPITLHTATVIRQQGLRLVFRDPVLTHLRHSTLPGSPAATVPGRGRCALPSASSPLPSSPQAACTAAPHRPVRSAHSPDL